MVKDLTPAELSNLWNSYLANTMAVFITRYTIAICQDQEVKNILVFAEKLAFDESQQAEQFIKDAGYPLPQAFTDKDVSIKAPRLYSDNLLLMIKYALTQDAAIFYSLSLGNSIDLDVRRYYETCVADTAKLFNMIMDLMVKKGLHHPVFHLPRPGNTEKVAKNSYLAGWFREQRPLNAQEINNLTLNFKGLEIQKEVARSFIQTTPIKELKEHFQRCVDIINKHLDLLQGILSENDLPRLPTWENEITDSTAPPFSERVMLFNISLLISSAVSKYGISISTAMRKDLGVDYLRLMTELLKYGEDTMNLMIEYQYLDQMPMAIPPKSL